MPTLKELFALFGKEAPEVPVRGLTLDSRRVEPGFVFVAVPGVPLPHRKPLDGHLRGFLPEEGEELLQGGHGLTPAAGPSGPR